MSELDDALDRLYAADPEDFTAVRKELVRELRDADRPEDADEVAARRKPPLPAFLANRLARERSRDVAALVDTAEKLAQAHRSGKAEALRDAQAALGEAVRTLVAAASEAAGRPVSDSVEQRLAETLRAAAVDSKTAAPLRKGILPDEVEASGFDALVGLPVPPAQRTSSGGRLPPRRQEESARTRRLKGQLSQAKRELREAEQALRSAERVADRARRRVAELEAGLGSS